MRSLRKPLLMLAAIALAVSVSVYATVAFLTDTETVDNVFTVGKVDILLDESITDIAGTPTGDRHDKGNEYHLVPGHTYTKDPMITVKADSEPCYVRMFLSINKYSEIKDIYGSNFISNENGGGLLVGWKPDVWVLYKSTQNLNEIVYEFRYRYDETTGTGATVTPVGNAPMELEPLFEKFTIPGIATGPQLAALQDLVISIQAHAIQAEGFGTADEAWAAFDDQNVSSASGTNAMRSASDLSAASEQLNQLSQTYSDLQNGAIPT